MINGDIYFFLVILLIEYLFNFIYFFFNFLLKQKQNLF